jgi:hypothetical protein
VIAHTRRFRRRQPKRHTLFLAMLPTIQRHALVAFRGLSAEAREEAVQEVVANTWVAFFRLVEQGRSERAFPTALARFAVAQVRDGRKVGTPQNAGDVLSPCARKQNRLAVVERLDRFDKHEGLWIEAVIEDTRTPVLDQVWFRIDFPQWLAALSSRSRQVAQALAIGNTTASVARQIGVSAGRVSQLRRELYESWQRFHGESNESNRVA